MAMKRSAPRIPRWAAAWALVLAAMALVVWARMLPRSFPAVEPAEREQLIFRSADGREYPYAFGYDSYAWLRQARNRVRTGSPCDTIVEGQCWDASTLAPVGSPMPYEHSPHVAAIALVHRLATLLRPAYPLSESAFLVTLIVGALGVPPAFAIGRRLAGNLGGLAAAVLVGLDPVFLVRSGTLDNDVWNVVLSLYGAWAAVGAMSERSLGRQAAWAVLAGCAFGLHALIWRGWVFAFEVVLAAQAANALAALLRAVARGRLRRDSDLRRAAGALGCFAALLVVGAGALAASAGTGRVVDLARSLAAEASAAMRPAPTPAAAPNWPDALGTVAELARPDLRKIAEMTGGTAYFFVGWLGMVLLLLPRRGWQWWHFALLVGANYAYRHLLVQGTPARSWLIAFLLLPLLVAVAVEALAEAHSAGEGADDHAVEPGAFVVVTWFLAALFLSFDGVRYVMLLAAPFGIACAVAIGRLHEWSEPLLARLAGKHRATLRAATFGVLCLALVPYVRFAERAASAQRPKVNDAWAETFERIRAEASPQAIVHTWWPYGYFASYLAERRVSVDGGALPTHVPHWIGRALLTADEDESAGLLRMLGCGSDATPHPEKDRGAYQRAMRWRKDVGAAHALLLDLARLDRSAAEAKLTSLGAPEAQRGSILEATHCNPPDSYLVLSDELISTTGWVRLGAWNPGDSAAVPRLDFWTRSWVSCAGDAAGPFLVCPLRLDLPERGVVIDGFAYRREDPAGGKLRWHRRAEAARSDGAPAEIVVAGAHGLQGTALADPLADAVGVLIDPSNDRILVASPPLLRSTLVHLVLLDGRYARRFAPLDQRGGYAGERVSAWRIRDEPGGGREDGRTSPPLAPSAR